jgi:hypothetical protein
MLSDEVMNSLPDNQKMTEQGLWGRIFLQEERIAQINSQDGRTGIRLTKICIEMSRNLSAST